MPAINQAPPPDLQALLSDKGRAAITQPADDIPALRLRALRDSAIAYGVRGGLARRAFAINQIVQDESESLDGLYNFTQIMLDHAVVPPVLTTSKDSVKISDGGAIRISDRTYTIESQAHFASSPPNWRDYLHPATAYAVSLPDAALMPKTPAETRVWKDYVAQGWVVGEDQANQVFAQSLARLNRDFQGMVLYRQLLAQGMVSRPYVARADLGVTGDGHSMAVNDRVLRITATPQLETHSDRWRALPVPASPTAEQP